MKRGMRHDGVEAPAGHRFLCAHDLELFLEPGLSRSFLDEARPAFVGFKGNHLEASCELERDAAPARAALEDARARAHRHELMERGSLRVEIVLGRPLS